VNNVVLVGFMGSGKTTVGRHLAEEMRRPFVDLDDEIAAEAGHSVAEIFAGEGEAGFRERESASLRRTLERDDVVIAAGGGAPLREENWRQMRSGNCVVALLTEPAELVRRLNGSSGRPLLQQDAPSAIAALLPQRQGRYRAADLLVRTDGNTPAEVANHIRDQLPSGGLQRIPVEVPGAEHEVTIGSHLTSLAPAALLRLDVSGTVVVISDQQVAQRHAAPLTEALASAGVHSTLHLVPAGEPAKELSVLAGIYDALGKAQVDRQGALIALGGGTVGDVAGFAAATWMRGIRYLQVPTTLLAMVDSSIGGKTGINLPAGKNLAGAVHQPSAIFCDLDYLATLPDEEYRTALAEVIKAAVIAERAFFDWLSVNLAGVMRREPAVMREAIARAISIKAAVVTRDPYESGERAILNYGHTVAHAIERAAGYGRVPHGDAVAWGMTVAARLSVMTESCSPSAAESQDAMLRAGGLLATRPAVRRADLLEGMRHDKKSRDGAPRWVLLREIGQVAYGRQVDVALVEAALAEVIGG
jgi:shikimate kinase/3-dehydroquinate synthase